MEDDIQNGQKPTLLMMSLTKKTGFFKGEC